MCQNAREDAQPEPFLFCLRHVTVQLFVIRNTGVSDTGNVLSRHPLTHTVLSGIMIPWGDLMNINLDLFLTFMKIGAFTFGGGYAMIPLIQREVCDNKRWLNEDDILEVVAISESTPGPVAINAATFVGRRTSGTFGAVCATLGVVLPSFIIISAISFVLKAFQESKAVQYAFMGIRAGVLALILKAVYTMLKEKKKHAVSYVIMAAALVLTAFLKIDAVFVISGCAVFGLVWSMIFRREKRDDMD